MKILITGSTSGIGLQLAKDYLAEGHSVYCCGRNRDALNELSDQFPDLAHPVEFDIQDRDAALKALGEVPSLDLAILNAGTCEYIDAKKFDAASFERVININLVGMANCLQGLNGKLGSGSSLALVGSSSSYVPLPRAEAYGASKAATEYLAKTLAISLGKEGIFVSYIAPGFVETPLTDVNDFPMPMRVDVDFASRKIRQGLAKKRREIHFPKSFTLVLKFIGILPGFLQRRLIALTLSS